MKTAIKVFLIMTLLLAGNTSRAQVFKHLWRGAPGTGNTKPFPGSNYRLSAADTLGNLYVLICDFTMPSKFGSQVLRGSYHIEKWNGTLWIKTSPIDVFTKVRYFKEEINPPMFNKMMVYNGSVVLAGKFDSTSNSLGAGIVAWDGLQWTAVGNGLFVTNRWKANSFQSRFEMKTAFEYKSKLVIAGNFDSIKGAIVNGVAQLNSNGQWENLGNVKGNTPFHMHRPDAAHFYQVIAPEIDVALDSMYFYQRICYTPDKLGVNGTFEFVKSGNQSRSWVFNNKMGTTLYSSDGVTHTPVSIPNNFVVRRVFEQNGELNLMGHLDSGIYVKLIAHRDAKGKWSFINLPDNDSISCFADSGLVGGQYNINKDYVFAGKLNTSTKTIRAIRFYTYDGNTIKGNRLLREDSFYNAYCLLKSGKKKYLAGSFLHLKHWGSVAADSFFNYASEILSSKTMVIKGKAFIDRNLDQVWQPNEPVLKNRMVSWKDSTNVASTDNRGNFILYLPAGTNREISINLNRYHVPAWSGSRIHSSSGDTLIYSNFPVGVTMDADLRAELVAYSGPKARHGGVSRYAIRVCNISGKAVKNVEVNLVINRKTSEFKSISPNTQYDSVRHIATWKFPGTLAGDSFFYLYYNCKYSADSFALGDSVYSTLRVLNNYSDADTTNNLFSLKQFISSAYDPNLKESNPNGRLIAKPDHVTYTIHFQNEGNDTAIRVQVLDTLNVIAPVFEVEIGAASHPFNFTVEKGIMVWEFDNIKLTTMEESEPGSSGFLTFTARINKPMKIGDSLRNRAGIYFDYQKPVITNYARILMVKPNEKSITSPVANSKNLEVFPNPFRQELNIRNKSAEAGHVMIYSMNGQVLCELEFKAFEERRIDMSYWSAGIYLLRSSSGEAVRIVKIH